MSHTGNTASPSVSAAGPRQFQFRKNPSASAPPVLQQKPDGEPSEAKSKMVKNWNVWVSEYDRKNERVIELLAKEHGAVWRQTARAPLVLQPFDQVEQKAYTTGHLSTFRSGSTPGDRSHGHESKGYHHQQQSQSRQHQTHQYQHQKKSFGHWREEKGARDDVAEQEEEILWATEETGVGMFDSEGNFKFITDSITSDQTSSSVSLDKSALFGINKAPAVKKDEWFYKDPKGVTQGPFSSSQMYDWYIRGFFPESLMLKQNDGADQGVYESLAVWKLRSEGQCPFEPKKPAAPGFSVPQQQPLPEVRFGSVSDDPIVNVPVRKQPVVASSPIDDVEQQRLFLEGLMSKTKKSDSLEDMVARQRDDLQAKYSQQPFEPSRSKPLKPVPLSNPVATAAATHQPQEQAAWKTLSNPPQINFEDVKKQQERDDYILLQQQQQAKQQQAQPSGPKSFAELLSSSNNTSIANITKNSPSSASIGSKPIQKPSSRLPSHQSAQPMQQPEKKPDSLKDWIMSKLSTIPNIDAPFLYILLSDCQSAEEAACLLRDNLLSASDQSADLKIFCKDYLKRRFGKTVSPHIIDIVCPRAVDDRDERPEAEFSTVIRRKK